MKASLIKLALSPRARSSPFFLQKTWGSFSSPLLNSRPCNHRHDFSCRSMKGCPVSAWKKKFRLSACLVGDVTVRSSLSAGDSKSNYRRTTHRCTVHGPILFVTSYHRGSRPRGALSSGCSVLCNWVAMGGRSLDPFGVIRSFWIVCEWCALTESFVGVQGSQK